MLVLVGLGFKGVSVMFVVTMSGELVNLLNVKTIYIHTYDDKNFFVTANFGVNEETHLFYSSEENCKKYLSKIFVLMEQKNITVSF